ncbi:MAG: hypothetical protein J6T22_09480 [Bacteroidales bacterium]|nr:hypothetical protein [Bacteroidales bacterium]MBO7617425.1 hypothetical protein [Bacteroidales bacterium]
MENKKHKYHLDDLLMAINLFDKDTDVTVDGINVIAVCPPVKLTKEGIKKFKPALDLPVDHLTVVSDDDADYDEDNPNSKLELAWQLLYSLAGYCSTKDYQKWFEDGTETQL